MGLSRLAVVAPAKWDGEAMHRMATREAASLIESMTVYPVLEEALAACGLVIGTTARGGRLRKPLWTPWRAAEHVRRLAPGNEVALLFGPEDRGLTNEELRLCHLLVRIPTAGFSSLNLAQAVLLICYELRRATVPQPEAPPPPLATVQELERMYAHLQSVLTEISVLATSQPDREMAKVRQFLSRIGLTSREVQMIRGACRQVSWYGDMRAKAAQDLSGGRPPHP